MFAYFNELSANGSIPEDSLPVVLRTLYECIERLSENHISSICIDKKIGQYQLTANRWFLNVLDDKTIVGIEEIGCYLTDILIVMDKGTFRLQLSGKSRRGLVITTYCHVPMKEETGDGAHADTTDANKIYSLYIF